MNTDNSDEIYVRFSREQYVLFANSIRDLRRFIYTERMQRPQEAKFFMAAGSYERRFKDTL